MLLSYIWLGPDEMPREFAANIEGAARLHPQLEPRIWRPSDLHDLTIPYFREASARGAWAFATDVARLFVLDRWGGIYADTDVHFARSASGFLDRGGLTIGWESDWALGPHMIAAEPGHPFIREMLNAYESRPFALDDTYADCVTMPIVATWVAQKRYGLTLDGQQQHLVRGNEHVWIAEQDEVTLDLKNGRNICRHDYAGGWLEHTMSYGKALHELRERRFTRHKAISAAARLLPNPVRHAAFNAINGPIAYSGAFTGQPGKNLDLLGRLCRRAELTTLPDRFSPLTQRAASHIRPFPLPRSDH
jgi:hypothetical protein